MLDYDGDCEIDTIELKYQYSKYGIYTIIWAVSVFPFVCPRVTDK
jgi:hypothetical protein